MDAKERCRNYRKKILEMSQKVTALHVAPSFSCVEIVDALYNEVMGSDDIFIMSKGHGVPAQYVVLASRGGLIGDHLDRYCLPGGVLGAHPDYATEMGIEASTGSLGHGLGIAVGRAYAKKLDGRGRVFCLLSDGEMAEGSVWEAMRMAKELKLDNLVALIDYNGWGGLERIDDNFTEKALTFGWDAIEIDGHDSDTIYESINGIWQDSPLMIVCNTIKGHPIERFIDNPIWHYRSPSAEEYREIIEELDNA